MSTLADRRKIKRNYRPDQPKFINPTTIYAYHRCNRVLDIHHIIHDKFYIDTGRNGQLYGPGLYSNYTLKAQQTKRMRTFYGNYLLRVTIDLSNYLILDQPLIDKFGKDSIAAQFIAKGIDLTTKTTAKSQEQFRTLANMTNYLTYRMLGGYSFLQSSIVSADLAKYLATNWINPIKVGTRILLDITKLFDGIVFTGRQDGTTIVSYNLNSVQFIDYARYNKADIDSGMQPLWRAFNSERRPENGVSFADKLLSETQQITNIRMARRHFNRHWQQLDHRARSLVFNKLYRTVYKSDVEPTFFDWLVSSSPGSDKRFVRWFAKFYGKPPAFAYSLKCANTRRSIKHSIIKVQPVPIRKTMMKKFKADSNYLGYKLYLKTLRLMYPEFMADWKAGLSQFMLSAPDPKHTGLMQTFTHKLTELYALWLDLIEGMFHCPSDEAKEFFWTKLNIPTEIRKSLNYGKTNNSPW